MQLLTIVLARAHFRAAIWLGARGERILEDYEAGRYLSPLPAVAAALAVLVACTMVWR